MLNSVSAGLSLPKEAVGKALDDAGLDRRVRAEQLTMQEFAGLYACLASQKE